ncbi:MAG: DUF4384 domain-containing protein [Arenibacterium sp.]
MSARLPHWGAGLIVSLVAHLGAGTALLAALQPEPVNEQPSPSSELEVEAYSLQRDKAQQSQPESEAAPEADAGETAVDPGAIPRSRAEARAPETTNVTATPPPAPVLPDAEAPADTVAVAAAPRTETLSEAQTAVASLAALAPYSTSVSSSTATSERLGASAAPVAAALATSVPVTATLPTLAPVAESLSISAPRIAVMEATPAETPELAATAPTAIAAPPAPPAAETAALVAPQTATSLPQAAPAEALADTPPDAAPVSPAQTTATPAQVSAAQPQTAAPVIPAADRVKATLAFPGGDGGVDPVSLAAFQSFMQPGDVTAEGDTLRDGVSALLTQVPCSRLQVAFDPETVTLRVNGHVPEDDLRAPVLAALGAQMGADIALSDNILVLPRPQCGALSGIADVGLPQSTDQITNPLLIGNDAHARVFGFVKDDPLSFDITGPEYPSYIYVDFFDAGGNVIHIAPNEQKPLRQHEADAPYQIGTRTPSEQGLHMIIAPPYGQEIVVAFAASEPLYEGLRPIIEPAAPYLEWLKARVTEARAANPDFKGEWVYFFVSTSES